MKRALSRISVLCMFIVLLCAPLTYAAFNLGGIFGGGGASGPGGGGGISGPGGMSAEYCGNFICSPGMESCSSCPNDCGACPPPAETCGNGFCAATESCSSCSLDCGACAPPLGGIGGGPPGGVIQQTCGNGLCGLNEDCTTCPQDCGACTPPPGSVGGGPGGEVALETCGNGICSVSETCDTCSSDCGECPPGGEEGAVFSYVPDPCDVEADGVAPSDMCPNSVELLPGTENFGLRPIPVEGAPTCTDSDGGADFFVKGTIEGVASWATSSVTLRPDTCVYHSGSGAYYAGYKEGNYVLEYTCDAQANTVNYAYQWCDYGCLDGACLASDHPASTCSIGVEVCDGHDNDCDGEVDEGCDDDLDDFCDAAIPLREHKYYDCIAGDNCCPHGGADCDDDNVFSHGGSAEVCDGFDNDCNPLTTEENTCPIGMTCGGSAGCLCEDGFVDLDGEPLNGCEHACPGAIGGLASDEICDGKDNDCDGIVDEGCDDDNDDFCDPAMTLDTSASCEGSHCCPASVLLPGNPMDCDDNGDYAYLKSPGYVEEGLEFCTDGFDNDCNGLTDAEEPLCTFIYVCDSENFNDGGRIVDDCSSGYCHSVVQGGDDDRGCEDKTWCDIEYGLSFQKCSTETLQSTDVGVHEYHVFMCDRDACIEYSDGIFEVEMDPEEDCDHDKLVNTLEESTGTLACDSDTDDDGLLDGDEDINRNGAHDPVIGETDPRLVDTDGDGFDDYQEATIVFEASPLKPGVVHTDPNVMDTDGDGFGDGAEFSADTNPLDPSSFPSDADLDCIPDAIEEGHVPNDVDNDGKKNHNDAEADGDTLDDGDEDKNCNGVLDAGETDPYSADTDGDGLHDNVELDGGTNPRVPDTDGDGLLDGEEDANGDGVVDEGETDPNNGDTDGDGFGDGSETEAGTDPTDGNDFPLDDDGDGIPNVLEGSQEVPPRDTDGDVTPDYLDTDSDNDNILDSIEDKNGDAVVDLFTGEDNSIPYETDPYKQDTDSDGLDDGYEDANRDGNVDATESDPRKVDTDGDGLGDFEEDKAGTNPQNTDSDGDGIPDGVEDANQNGVVDEGETDPTNPDTDGDGLDDGVEDADKDGVVDDGETDPTNPDTDGDGVPDGAETELNSDPLDPSQTPTDFDGDCIPDELEGDGDADGDGFLNFQDTDSDGDGLADGLEDTDCNGRFEDTDVSSLLLADTDGDCFNDRVELDLDTNPKDDQSTPHDPDNDCIASTHESDTSESYACENGLHDATEEGIDCGGSCAYECTESGQPDVGPGDCVGGVCYTGCEDDADCDGWKDDTELACGSDVDDPLSGCDEGNPLDDYTDEEKENLDNMDTDGDGVSNLDELIDGTNPNDPDTDDDGYYDGTEKDAGTDPLDSTDFPDNIAPDNPVLQCEDGIQQDNEDGADCGGACLYVCDESGVSTHTCEDDFDCDGWRDSVEEACGTSATDPTSVCDEGNPLDDYTDEEVEALKNMDTDGDGLSNFDELLAGTNPAVADTDGDGFDDDAELDHGSDPLDDDEQPDGKSQCVGDVCDEDHSCDVILDADCDGLDNAFDKDSDNDGINDIDEISLGTDPSQSDTDGDGFTDGAEVAAGTDPLNVEDVPSDKDGDGIPDSVEGSLDSDGDGIPDDEDTDSDNDGLLDSEEDLNGDGKVQNGETDAYKADSDVDGFNDKEELEAGSDPLDPNSTPVSPVAGVPSLAERIEKSDAQVFSKSKESQSKDRFGRQTKIAQAPVESEGDFDVELADDQSSSGLLWTMIAVVLLVVLGSGSYLGYEYYYKPKHTPAPRQQQPTSRGNPRQGLKSQVEYLRQKKLQNKQRKEMLLRALDKKSPRKLSKMPTKGSKKPTLTKVSSPPKKKGGKEIGDLQSLAGNSGDKEFDALEKIAKKKKKK